MASDDTVLVGREGAGGAVALVTINRPQVLNALNQTQYKDVSTNMSSITFGQIIQTESARTIQLQLRLSF